jgi:hypothetical protein
MTIRSTLVLSWQDFWSLKKHHAGALWARVLMAAVLAGIAWGVLCLLGVAGILTVTDAAFLRRLAAGGGLRGLRA